MSNVSPSRTLIDKLAFEADLAIDAALRAGSPTMIRSPRTEIEFVAAVTLGSVHDIATAWRPLCRAAGLRLTLTGVFCHAAPRVRFLDGNGRQRQCELADLLIVADVGSPKSFVRQAVLVQAKMARAMQRVSLAGPSSRVQLDLYQNWHVFDFSDPVYGLSQLNLMTGAGAIYSGTIGVLDRHLHLKAQPVWTQHRVKPTPATVSNEPRLGTFMAEMAGNAIGFGREASPSLQTDWSKTIERLLDVTYKQIFHNKAVLGPGGMRRGAHEIVYLMRSLDSAVSSASSGGPPYDYEIQPDDSRPGGISLVHIVLRPFD